MWVKIFVELMGFLIKGSQNVSSVSLALRTNLPDQKWCDCCCRHREPTTYYYTLASCRCSAHQFFSHCFPKTFLSIFCDDLRRHAPWPQSRDLRAEHFERTRQVCSMLAVASMIAGKEQVQPITTTTTTTMPKTLTAHITQFRKYNIYSSTAQPAMNGGEMRKI